MPKSGSESILRFPSQKIVIISTVSVPVVVPIDNGSYSISGMIFAINNRFNRFDWMYSAAIKTNRKLWNILHAIEALNFLRLPSWKQIPDNFYFYTSFEILNHSKVLSRFYPFPFCPQGLIDHPEFKLLRREFRKNRSSAGNKTILLKWSNNIPSIQM